MQTLIDLRNLGCSIHPSHLAIQEYAKRPDPRLVEDKRSMEARVLEVQNTSGQAIMEAYTTIRAENVVGEVTKIKLLMDERQVVGLQGIVTWNLAGLKRLGLYVPGETINFEHLRITPRVLYTGSGPSRILTKLICFDAKVDF